jgi:glutathione peroxidase
MLRFNVLKGIALVVLPAVRSIRWLTLSVQLSQLSYENAEIAVALYDFNVRLSGGGEHPLAHYRSKVLLVVNVASRCGFTPQYEGLQALYEKFRPHGFEVLAFPCNQFGGQEPGEDREIARACTQTFGVTFPLFAKIEVNGNNAHPLYAWLKQQGPGFLGNSIRWNFTKFLVDRTGTVRSRFAPMTSPQSLARHVANLL